MLIIGLWLRIYHSCCFCFISTSAMPWFFFASDKLLLGAWLWLGKDNTRFQFRVDLKILFITFKALHDLHFWATLSGRLGHPSRTLSYPWVSLGGHRGKQLITDLPVTLSRLSYNSNTLLQCSIHLFKSLTQILISEPHDVPTAQRKTISILRSWKTTFPLKMQFVLVV